LPYPAFWPIFSLVISIDYRSEFRLTVTSVCKSGSVQRDTRFLQVVVAYLALPLMGLPQPQRHGLVGCFDCPVSSLASCSTSSFRRAKYLEVRCSCSSIRPYFCPAAIIIALFLGGRYFSYLALTSSLTSSMMGIFLGMPMPASSLCPLPVTVSLVVLYPSRCSPCPFPPYGVF